MFCLNLSRRVEGKEGSKKDEREVVSKDVVEEDTIMHISSCNV